MMFIRDKILRGDLMYSIGAQLGSSLTVEMISNAGFDWTWIDCEHGSGDYSELVYQLQVARLGNSPPVVRISWNMPWLFKRVLDLGAAGIMVPYVNTAAEAEEAVQSMHYQPEGVRGVAGSPPCAGFAQQFDDYFAQANDNLTLMVQIETAQAVENAASIAAVSGVDVLFVGPLDLSVNLGIPKDFRNPRFEACLDTVVEGCRKHGKAPGILTPTLDFLPSWIDRGFTVFIVGSDGTLLAKMLGDIKEKCASLSP
ncbi:MAG: aldolase/citrate lyase family protein [Desulfobacterales bacterium]